MWVLKRNQDGKFVGCSPKGGSYTSDLARATVFPSREAAERDKCDNETAVRVDDAMQGRRL